MMLNRRIWWLLSCLALLGALGVTWREAALAADARQLACPPGQVVWLEGEGRPYTGLLILLRGRAVGGGSVGADGRWRLPLQVDEPPGSYPGAVVERADRSALLGFTCYVDRPFGDDPPPPTGSVAPVRTATATPVPPESLISPTATALAGEADQLRFGDVGLSDPSTSGSYGYAAIISSATTVIDLTGWQLVNQSRPELPGFSFPPYQIIAKGSVTILLEDGASTADTLYWAVAQQVWFSGDTLALRTPQGTTVTTVVVPFAF